MVKGQRGIQVANQRSMRIRCLRSRKLELFGQMRRATNMQAYADLQAELAKVTRSLNRFTREGN